MSRFTDAWLRLREPSDARARSHRVIEPLVRWSRARRRIRVLDLGGGTGANLRFLAPQLPSRQDWIVVDRDESLLAHASLQAPVPVATEACDIARGFDWLDRRAVDLVTASALLDLVSAQWLDELLQRCSARRIAVHMALTYDGVIRFDPPDSTDELVRDGVNRHQSGDKGFGPALGPAAATHAADALRRLGYVVVTDESPWCLGPMERHLQQALIEGWAAAGTEIEPSRAGEIEDWRIRRSASIAAGTSALEVGHSDLTALPERDL